MPSVTKETKLHPTPAHTEIISAHGRRCRRIYGWECIKQNEQWCVWKRLVRRSHQTCAACTRVLSGDAEMCTHTDAQWLSTVANKKQKGFFAQQPIMLFLSGNCVWMCVCPCVCVGACVCGIQTLAIAILYTSKGTGLLYYNKHIHIFMTMNFALDFFFFIHLFLASHHAKNVELIWQQWCGTSAQWCWWGHVSSDVCTCTNVRLRRCG